MNETEMRQALGGLFRREKLAVLATQDNGQPYTSLVAFAAAADLTSILFATPRSTRKFANMTADPRVALLMDNRANREADFQEAMAVTVTGVAQEFSPGASPALLALYSTRHPHLADFISASDTALMAVRVQQYTLVTRFQQVTGLYMA